MKNPVICFCLVLLAESCFAAPTISNVTLGQDGARRGHVSDMLKTFGYSFSGAGENIAHHATTEKAHAAFMSHIRFRSRQLSPPSSLRMASR